MESVETAAPAAAPDAGAITTTTPTDASLTSDQTSVGQDVSTGDSTAAGQATSVANTVTPGELSETDRSELGLNPGDVVPPGAARILADLKRINPETRRVLKDAWFRDQALSKAGWHVNDVRDLSAMGFTPETAREFRSVFPTNADAQAAYEESSNFRSFMGDFRSNPANLLQNMFAVDPQAASRLVEFVANSLPQVAPNVHLQVAGRQVWKNLMKDFQEAQASGDEALQSAVLALASRWFPGSVTEDGRLAQRNGSQNMPPEVAQHVQRLQQENARIAEEHKRLFEAQRETFSTGVVERVKPEVVNSIRQFVSERRTPWMSDAMMDGFVNQIAADVYEAMRSQPKHLGPLGGVLDSGRFDQGHAEQFGRALKERAMSLVPDAYKNRFKTMQDIADSFAKSNPTPTPKPPPARAGAAPVGTAPAAGTTPKFKPGYAAGPDAIMQTVRGLLRN